MGVLVILSAIALVVIVCAIAASIGDDELERVNQINKATLEDCLFNNILGYSAVIENGKVVDFINERDEFIK
jgi:hypothetical protein